MRNECPRCAEEWRTKRETSQSRVNEVYSNIHQIEDDEKRKALKHEKEMADLQGNLEAQKEVLEKRVCELQDENKTLLQEVDRLKKEIDESTRTHTEKVKALTYKKNQLLAESEALFDISLTLLQNAVSELSTNMNEVMQSRKEDVYLVKSEGLQAVVTNQSLKSTTPLFPLEIRQCNAELESTRVERRWLHCYEGERRWLYFRRDEKRWLLWKRFERSWH